jgi:hypothetical protein
MKAHIAKMMHKLGIHNRIELSCSQLPVRSSVCPRIDYPELLSVCGYS